MSTNELFKLQGIDPEAVVRTPDVSPPQLGQMLGNAVAQNILQVSLKAIVDAVDLDGLRKGDKTEDRTAAENHGGAMPPKEIDQRKMMSLRSACERKPKLGVKNKPSVLAEGEQTSQAHLICCRSHP